MTLEFMLYFADPYYSLEDIFLLHNTSTITNTVFLLADIQKKIIERI
jgi:hypothetical protein